VQIAANPTVDNRLIHGIWPRRYLARSPRQLPRSVISSTCSIINCLSLRPSKVLEYCIVCNCIESRAPVSPVLERAKLFWKNWRPAYLPQIRNDDGDAVEASLQALSDCLTHPQSRASILSMLFYLFCSSIFSLESVIPY
jgi:hypothetical protein